jgi:VanZ family protein
VSLFIVAGEVMMDLAQGTRSKLAAVITVITLAYWLAMFVGTHIPASPNPGQYRFHSLDKVEHLAAFAGLAVLLCTSGSLRGFSPRGLFAGILALTGLYGLVDELTQRLVPRRTPDVRDWVADMLGAGLGIALFVVLRPLVSAGWSVSAETKKNGIAREDIGSPD